MSKKEEFRTFIQDKPELVRAVGEGKTTWQKLYEVYDLYGENSKAWEELRSPKTIAPNISQITNMIKNIDVNSIQKHINTAQKALGVVQELTTKGAVPKMVTKGPLTPRPLNKFFED